MSQTILLVGNLPEAREIPHEGMRIVSCGQNPGSYAGLSVAAVYATEAAKQHRDYEKVLLTLRYCASKTKPAGMERVV